MGFAKNRKIEEEERGYGSLDKVVCSNCVGNYALKKYIEENGTEITCDYCEGENICVEAEDILSEIFEGINFEYDEAIECMGREEGEYIGANTWDTYDLLYDLQVELDLKDVFFTDVLRIIKDTTWCERDPYQLRQSRERVSMWNAFSHLVKNKTRYVFFRMPEKDIFGDDESYNILDYIGDEILKLGLIKNIPAGTNFYRGRMHDKHTRLKHDSELGSPPLDKAKSNRMSAEGISIFYGADDERTALSEIFDSRFKYATTVAFKNTDDINIIDLTKITNISLPSLFDPERRELRESLLFFKKLNENLTRPIESLESIEYIPAQIFAEYIRFIFSDNYQEIHGIAYHSSKVTSGKCYALFYDQNQCSERNLTGDIWGTTQQMMKMDNDTLRTFKIGFDIVLDPFTY